MSYKVLVVEDEAIIYDRLSRRLIREGFEVLDYTKSYEEAISRIESDSPDIVLLDIELQGEKTGLDVGRALTHKYKIPFIILSSHFDPLTIEKSLHINHSQFIIKSKPVLNMDQVLIAIKTVLHRRELKNLQLQKDGLIGLTSYLNDIKQTTQEEITRVPINFNEIVYFTVGQYEDESGSIEFVKKNYVVFETLQKKIYFLKGSLSGIMENLPPHFVKISGSSIINIKAENFDGRINGSRVVSGGKTFSISNKFREEFDKKMKIYYQH